MGGGWFTDETSQRRWRRANKAGGLCAELRASNLSVITDLINATKVSALVYVKY
jgi:hypothetical protein